MPNLKQHVLPLIFLLQAVLNLVFYGFPAFMFSVIVPNSLYEELARTLPFAMLLYFGLGILALHYISTGNLQRGRPLGVIYLGFGALGSAAVLSRFSNDAPALLVLHFLWLVLSIAGIVLLLLGVGASRELSIVAMVLLGLSALLSAFVADWMVTDYYIHVHMGDNIPENASVIVAYPENVSINATG